MERCVLAYSGGLDTTVIASILQELGIEVVALTLEIGQKEDMREIAARAKSAGVKKIHAVNALKEFVADYIFPAVQANCLYEGLYPEATALGRPLIVKHLVEVARKEKCQAVAHGSTGKGNDQIRFENGVSALAPELKVIAPVRDWELWRDEEVEYARERGIPVSTVSKKYSVDENIWGRSIEAGPVEKPELEVPEDAFAWSVAPERAPDKPTYAKTFFENGVPQSVEFSGGESGRVSGPVEIVEALNRVAGKNGVGRIDHMEDRVIGFKSREAYEAPAALVLLPAHRELEKTVLTKDELEFKAGADHAFSELVYRGQWWTPLRETLQELEARLNEPVSGSATVKLFKGSARVVARESPNALYSLALASYDKKATTWSQREGAAFTKLFGLQNAMAWRLRKKGKKR
ncbi:MAG: argininosuccinate synthase [Candidatus Micrarchaeia archaeon]